MKFGLDRTSYRKIRSIKWGRPLRKITFYGCSFDLPWHNLKPKATGSIPAAGKILHWNFFSGCKIRYIIYQYIDSRSTLKQYFFSVIWIWKLFQDHCKNFFKAANLFISFLKKNASHGFEYMNCETVLMTPLLIDR